MNFGDAIKRLKEGGKVARLGWNGKGMWLALQVPDANSKMTLPYIYMKTADDKLVPWLASQSDVLSEDWQWVCSECDTMMITLWDHVPNCSVLQQIVDMARTKKNEEPKT